MTFNALTNFAFFYPLIMAWVWIIGGVWYYLRWERRKGADPDHPPDSGSLAACSIIIPCFNEAEVIRDTIHYAHASEYHDFEIIAVNDGSSDASPEILEQLTHEYPRLRVVHLASNQGKAVALRTGALAAQNDFLICIDGDALLHPNAVAWMMFHLTSVPEWAPLPVTRASSIAAACWASFRLGSSRPLSV